MHTEAQQRPEQSSHEGQKLNGHTKTHDPHQEIKKIVGNFRNVIVPSQFPSKAEEDAYWHGWRMQLDSHHPLD